MSEYLHHKQIKIIFQRKMTALSFNFYKLLLRFLSTVQKNSHWWGKLLTHANLCLRRPSTHSIQTANELPEFHTKHEVWILISLVLFYKGSKRGILGFWVLKLRLFLLFLFWVFLRFVLTCFCHLATVKFLFSHPLHQVYKRLCPARAITFFAFLSWFFHWSVNCQNTIW